MLVPRYGEVVNLNLVRDKTTGKSKGFCFLCYEDQRSTVLAVDNLNGIKVCIALHCVLYHGFSTLRHFCIL
jgi:RNA recognition motif-containing protein